jgi:hypothetical protein
MHLTQRVALNKVRIYFVRVMPMLNQPRTYQELRDGLGAQMLLRTFIVLSLWSVRRYDTCHTKQLSARSFCDH